MNAKRVVLRDACREDLESVLEQLRRASLPTDGVAEWFDQFVVAAEGELVVGAAGIERYGPDVLLRSVVVAPEWQGRGVGRDLVREALERASRSGARAAFLLTTTAEHYFPRLGFRRIEREEVPRTVRESVEFRSACPESAAVMVRRLSKEDDDALRADQ
jgi:amino-acid N-acetyltransferase